MEKTIQKQQYRGPEASVTALLLSDFLADSNTEAINDSEDDITWQP